MERATIFCSLLFIASLSSGLCAPSIQKEPKEYGTTSMLFSSSKWFQSFLKDQSEAPVEQEPTTATQALPSSSAGASVDLTTQDANPEDYQLADGQSFVNVRPVADEGRDKRQTVQHHTPSSNLQGQRQQTRPQWYTGNWNGNNRNTAVPALSRPPSSGIRSNIGRNNRRQRPLLSGRPIVNPSAIRQTSSASQYQRYRYNPIWKSFRRNVNNQRSTAPDGKRSSSSSSFFPNRAVVPNRLNFPNSETQYSSKSFASSEVPNKN